jgi:cyclin A
MVCKKSGTSNSLDIVDIDSNVKDPQVCGSYAPDIYSNIRVVEVCAANTI